MHKTDQEQFWSGAFGDHSIDRWTRVDIKTIAARNASFFSHALARADKLRSILEVGANVGFNLLALSALFPEADIEAVEINSKAAEELRRLSFLKAVHEGSILDLALSGTYDLVFTKGVLIHINPDELTGVYDKLYSASSRYVLLAEYFNPKPVEVEYHGQRGMLFKRDFAGEMLDRFDDLHLVDYGFVYKRDPNFHQDNLNWFLLEKRS